MYLWIFALLLTIALGLVGYYSGALKATFTLLGLVVAALLCRPVAVVFDFILPALGLTHPAVLSFVSPLLGFMTVLAAFKIAAFALHKKVDTWYKYKGSDTQRLLWERLNSRVGIAVGVVNAYVYLLLLSTLFYSLGYFTYQMATNRQESWIVNLVNRLARDIGTTGMIKSIAPFAPATDVYYDGCDILADLFHSPLLQNRLANYPPFLTLGDRPEFNGFKDSKFQEEWARGMSLREFASHEKVAPLVQNHEIYTNVLAIARPDMKDLKTYLETGASPKYDEEKILGKWRFSFRGSIAEARRRKPTIGSLELRKIRLALTAAFANATLVATPDNRAIMKLPSLQNKTVQGTWKSAGGGQYMLNVSEGKGDIEASVDGKKIIFVKDGFALVFENTRV
jgi:hypothetical protein